MRRPRNTNQFVDRSVSGTMITCDFCESVDVKPDGEAVGLCLLLTTLNNCHQG